jgi:hypothetical protein
MKLNRPLTAIITASDEDLCEILKDPDFCEDRFLEFKAKFYEGNSSAKELRKDFSAFANSGGGLIFFGVDKRKNICGINSLEIRREISQKLTGCGIDWDIINTINLRSGKYVYIAQIYEEPLYWKKPIIVDGSIWYRENGTCAQVSDIAKHFKYDKFLLSDIKYFEYLCNEDDEILERIEHGYPLLPFYYVRIFVEFEIFIKDTIGKFVSDHDKQKAKALLSKFQRISKKFGEKPPEIYMAQESSTTPSLMQNSLNKDLQEIILDFKDLYLNE